MLFSRSVVVLAVSLSALATPLHENRQVIASLTSEIGSAIDSATASGIGAATSPVESALSSASALASSASSEITSAEASATSALSSSSSAASTSSASANSATGLGTPMLATFVTAIGGVLLGAYVVL